MTQDYTGLIQLDANSLMNGTQSGEQAVSTIVKNFEITLDEPLTMENLKPALVMSRTIAGCFFVATLPTVIVAGWKGAVAALVIAGGAGCVSLIHFSKYQFVTVQKGTFGWIKLDQKSGEVTTVEHKKEYFGVLIKHETGQSLPDGKPHELHLHFPHIPSPTLCPKSGRCPLFYKVLVCSCAFD